jgi:hypothetical protein
MKTPGPKRKGQHRWKGELAKPLLVGVGITSLNEIASKETRSRLQEAIREKRIEKLVLLAKHFKVGETDYLSLALELAKDHVPGFRIGRASELLRLKHGDYGAVLGNKRGRKRESSLERSDRLVDDVEKTKKRLGCQTDREALEDLARHKEWSPPTNNRGGFKGWVKTLQNQLANARRRPGN